MNTALQRKKHAHVRILGSNQHGLVSITVTMILMVVMSFIVLGFAQVARRSQRQALDQQLSTQAFYAAESGINDVQKLIKDAGVGASVPEKTSCPSGGGGGFYNSLNSTVDGPAGVSYSCLLVDPAPTTLQYDNVADPTRVIPLSSYDGTNIHNATITWKSSDPNPTTNCPVNASFALTNTSDWGCGYGVLRLDIIPMHSGSFDVDELTNSVMTTFAVPITSGAVNSVNFAAGPGQNLIGVRCTNAECGLTINFAGANLSDTYYLRINSLYKQSSLRISAQNGSGTQQRLAGAQVMVDATGKAQDVLRRIQVRMPSVETYRQLPAQALESSESVCKRFAAMDGYFGQTGLPGGTNPLCADIP